MNLKEAELIQYRRFVGVGPSLNTCPRCEFPNLLLVSTLVIPAELSVSFSMYLVSIGLEKLGQPQPESNLSEELNNGSPETTSTYIPTLWLSQYSFWKGFSVAFF